MSQKKSKQVAAAPAKPVPGPLHLNTARLGATRRVDALFNAMATDYLLREQFVTAPSQILSEYVHGGKPSPAEASVSDQLIYAVMANQGLVRWLRENALRQGGRPVPKERFMQAFGEAVVQHKASHVVLSLMRASVERVNAFGADDALLSLLFGVFVGGGYTPGTEMSTGTYATEQSGTHISGGGFGGDVFSTERSTDVGTTQMSTGTYATEQSGTHISGGFSSGTEMSTGTYATEQSGTHISGGVFGGQVSSTGTEVSGTGTERTTDVGTTQMSTGNRTDLLSGLFASRQAMVTFEALASYAMQLRQAGALDNLGR